MSPPLPNEKPTRDDDPFANSGASSLTSDEEYANPTGINEKSLIRKLDLKLLPPLTLLYLLSFLDRSNIGNAKLDGLTTDLGITGNQYLFTLTIYFIAYVIFEVPCNVILKRTTPRFWLPTLMLLWVIVATLMAVAQSFGGFVAARFFLGVTESGLFPGVVFYLSMWYKRTETHYRVSLFFSAASLAGAFGGILAYGIGFMKGVGGYAGWRWIFIIEGPHRHRSPHLLLLHPQLPLHRDLPHRARTSIHQRPSQKHRRHKHRTLPLVQRPQSPRRLQMLALRPRIPHHVPPPLHTLPLPPHHHQRTRLQERRSTTPHRASLRSRHGLNSHHRYPRRENSQKSAFHHRLFLSRDNRDIILLTAPGHKPGVSYLGTIFAAAGIYPSTAIVLSWPAANVSGQTKRATAMTITIGNLGAVLGTQLYRPATSPRWFLGHGFACGYLVANIGVVCALWVLLERENRIKAERAQRGEVKEGRIENDEDVRWLFQT